MSDQWPAFTLWCPPQIQAWLSAVNHNWPCCCPGSVLLIGYAHSFLFHLLWPSRVFTSFKSHEMYLEHLLSILVYVAFVLYFAILSKIYWRWLKILESLLCTWDFFVETTPAVCVMNCWLAAVCCRHLIWEHCDTKFFVFKPLIIITFLLWFLLVHHWFFV